LDHYRLKWVMFWGMAFGDVNLDSCTLIGIRETDARIRQHNLVRASTEKQDVRRIPQSYFEQNTDYKFNLYWNPDIENLKHKTEAGAKRFGELFHSHEGIHSGNIRRKLFVDRKINSTCRPFIFGRSEIRQYGLIWAGTYVHYRADIIDKSKGEYAHLAKEEYFTQPKILVRRTGDHVMAAVDRNNFFCSNNLFVCVPRVAIDLDFVAAVLNSNLMTWYFRTIQPRVKRLFAELKIVHLNEFPINHSKPHDIRELSELGKKASKLALSKGSEEALGSVTSAINKLVYQLYGLDEKETELIEKSLEDRGSRLLKDIESSVDKTELSR